MIGSLSALGAGSAYDRARAAIAPQAGAPQSSLAQPPSAGGTAADRFMQMMQQVDAAATGAMTGAVETQKLVQTIAEAELALEKAVAIRDRVVEAYQELMRMPV